jgi:predicted DNA-binding transcriptional regulator AlpA
MPKQKSANPVNFHINKRADAILAASAGNGNDDDLLTPLQTADWLGVSMQWLAIRRSRGDGPPCVRLSPKVVRYRRGDVRSWLNQCANARMTDYTRRRTTKKRRTEARLNAT